MTDDIVIQMEQGWKRYGTTLTTEFHRFWHHRQKGKATPFPGDEIGQWNLADISFDIRRGEILGVIGRNGAGKSTLLKVLAGVSPLTKGRFVTKGRMFPMVELNAGMHNDLTGRQNVYLLGAIMGFSPDEIQRRMPEIEEFCELGEYFDRPVWIYSSGMVARLGFAVAVNVSADILLVDEVLAVGDISFQRKCFDRIEKLYKSGVSLVFVSHSLRMVERLCTRAIYLKDGRIAAYGLTSDVITKYELDSSEDLLSGKQTEGNVQSTVEAKTSINTPANQPELNSDHTIWTQAIELLNEEGQVTNTFFTGRPLTIRVHYLSKEEVKEPVIGFGMSRESVYITGFTSELCNDETRLKEGEGFFDCRIQKLMLLTGVYNISIKYRASNGATLGGGSGLVYFSVQTPAEIRRSNQYGYILTEALWDLDKN